MHCNNGSQHKRRRLDQNLHEYSHKWHRTFNKFIHKINISVKYKIKDVYIFLNLIIFFIDTKLPNQIWKSSPNLSLFQYNSINLHKSCNKTFLPEPLLGLWTAMKGLSKIRLFVELFEGREFIILCKNKCAYLFSKRQKRFFPATVNVFTCKIYIAIGILVICSYCKKAKHVYLNSKTPNVNKFLIWII